MLQKPLRILVTSTLLASSSLALALPFNSFDPRTMAMGGAGVAVPDPSTAPFFNPALLSTAKEEDDFSMDLPIIGIRAYDPEKFVKSIDDFQNGNYVDTLQTSIDTYNATQNSPNLNAVATNVSTLSTQLKPLSDKPLQAEIGAGMVIGIPSKSFGGALYANGWGAVGGMIKYRDDQTLQDFSYAATTVDACATALDMAPCQADPIVTQYFDLTNPASPQVTFDTTQDIQSSINIRGVAMTEVGVALSREFGSDTSAWALGITPKVVRATLFDYSANVNSGDTGDATGEDYTAKYTGFNFDLGLAKDFGDGWRSGLVVKNVIPHTYDFKRFQTNTGDTLKLKPQARIGASHSTGWSTVAMDIDLTANDPAGLENKSQYVGIGGELNAWSILQLRLGYRADLKNSKRSVASAGVGIGPLDVAVAGSANEIGASLALGFTF